MERTINICTTATGWRVLETEEVIELNHSSRNEYTKHFTDKEELLAHIKDILK